MSLPSAPDPQAQTTDEAGYNTYSQVLYNENVMPGAPVGRSASFSAGSDQHARKRSTFAVDEDDGPFMPNSRPDSLLAKDGLMTLGGELKDSTGSGIGGTTRPPLDPSSSSTGLVPQPIGTDPLQAPIVGAAVGGGLAGLGQPAHAMGSSRTNSLASWKGGDGSKMPGSVSRFGLLDTNAQLSGLSTYQDADIGELDDDLHRVDPIDAKSEPKDNQFGFSIRGVIDMATMMILILALLMLFAGYPIFTALTQQDNKMGGYGPGGTNGTGQISNIPGVRTSLIDPDTPKSEHTRKSAVNPKATMNLVFSDEFNTPGRSFYPGDDPFWEAVDLYYWQTNNYEWYDPAAVTTADGALRIQLSQHPEHEKNFRGGMIQSWNKFCFTGGVLVASIRLPGNAKAAGLWPAVWIMGNLGRAGYGASLEGAWPYSYDACDIGTLANQTDPSTQDPEQPHLGDCQFNQKHNSKSLSFLPGQRLSACTCPGEDHPGPQFPNGSYAGRMAPEIDLLEAQIGGNKMTVSQSCQFAPYNAYYKPMAKPMFFDDHTILNTYTGEVTQQSMSGVTPTDQSSLQYLSNMSTGIFSEYALEYKPGHGGHVQWEASGKQAWRLRSEQLAADPVSKIAERPVPPEPMYIIANLGSSQNFGTPDWKGLVDLLPARMDIDWIRVYQEGNPKIGCDPPDFPTAAYIARHKEAYSNANLTLWGGGEGGYDHPWPRNRLYPGGCDAKPSKNPGSPTHPIPKAKIYDQNDVGEAQDKCSVDSWNDGQKQN